MQIVVNEIVTNYQIIESESSKEPLLILHGWQRDLSEWVPVAERLSDQYKVILLDLPGFGGTNKAEADFDTYDYANFCEEFLKKLKVEKCAVLGHSFGGRIGIVLAAKTNLVSKLILVDSAGLREKESPLTKIKRAMFKLIFKILPKPISIRVKNLLGSEDYKSSGSLRNTFVKVVNQDLSSLLSEIKAETLIIWGSEDPVLSVSQTKIFKKLIPKSKVRIVWSASHSPHIEKPESFFETISQFLM